MKKLSKENQMNKTFTFYHGDIDFFKVNTLPDGIDAPTVTKSHIAQEGTASGHKHLVTSKHGFKVYSYGENGLAYEFDHPAEISHEEHRTHDIAPGIYLVEHEQEEDPREGIVREVID